MWTTRARFLPIAVFILACAGVANAQTFSDQTDASGAAGSWETCGVGAEDIDGDGDLDLCATAVGGGSTRIYRNNGDGTFTDIADSGVGGESMICTFGDIDNDGLPDLFLGFYWGSSRMFTATGGAVPFTDITAAAGVGVSQTWTGNAFADVDNDGDLDLFVARAGGNRLFINNGSGVFTNEAAARGVEDSSVGCHAVAFADVDGDGDLDLFLGRDLNNVPRLYLNDGTGHFTDNAASAGLLGATGARVAAFADIDNDGDLDLYVAKWGNCFLFINDGSGHFTDISVSSGVTGQPSPFGCAFGDYDNDGDLDLFISQGEFGGGSYVNLLYRNDGGNVFTEVAATEGVQDIVTEHRGAIFFDQDGDGDLDLYVGRKTPADGNKNKFYRNGTNNSNYLLVKAVGTVSNKSAVGAKFWVYEAGHLWDPAYLRGFREVSAGSGLGSSPPLVQHFGLSSTLTYDVTVCFPKGNVVTLTGVSTGQKIVVTEPLPPTVTSVTAGGIPLAGAALGSEPSQIAITFSKAMDGATVTSGTAWILASGGDGTFEDGNEVAITPVSVTCVGAAAMVDLTGVPLADDVYQLRLESFAGGRALSFDGTDDFAWSPQWLNGTGNTVTFEAWCRPAGAASGDMNIVLHRADYNDAWLAYNTTTFPSPAIRFSIPQDEIAHFESGAISGGTWYHLAGVFDGSEVRLYVDGDLRATHSVTKSLNWNTGYFGSYIGANGWNGTGYFPGDVDEVRVWTVARIQAQIRQNMCRSLSGSEAGLASYYRFEEAGCQAITDSSPNGKNGRLGATSGIDPSDPARVDSIRRGIKDGAGNLLDGEYTGTLPSGNGTAGGNLIITFTVDTTAPTVTVDQAAGQQDPTSSIPVQFTAIFSEPVTGFTGADVTLSGTAGATTAIVTGGPQAYTVSVTGMTGQGTVAVTIGAGVATDSAGNGNAASSSTDNGVSYDATAPGISRITSTSADGSYWIGAEIEVVVEFTESVNLTGGNLQFTLDTGAIVLIAPFGPASSAAGTYTVRPRDASENLTVVGPPTLSGGTLRDALGNDAVLSIPVGQNLADTKDIVVNGAPIYIKRGCGSVGLDLLWPIGIFWIWRRRLRSQLFI